MAPKVNSKAAAGRARKQEAEDKKKDAQSQKKEEEEASKWEKGAKGKSAADAKAEKAAEAARKKAELERLKKEDEEALPKGPSEGKAKLSAQAAKRDTKANFKSIKTNNSAPGGIDAALESFSADNIDDAIDALSLVTEKTDAASRGSKAADIERHPERRFKAAFEAFKERRIPELRKENPGLRLQQVQELAYKEFQKSEENPFNQVHLSYDADKQTKLATLDSVRSGKEARLKQA